MNAEAPDLLPLSSGQEALWFAYRLQPHGSAYNVGIAVRVRTEMAIPALSRAVAATVGRHDLLRSAFSDVSGRPVRKICPPSPAQFEVRDLPGATESQLRAAANAEVSRPFRLEAEFPFRVVLLRAHADDAVLLACAHHIVTDADSQLFILRDVLDAYLAIRGGGGPGWRPLASSYAGYAAAERDLLASPRASVLEGYWREACAGAQAALPLLADRSAEPAQRFSGARHEFIVAGDLTKASRIASRGMGVTPFMCLLGVFQTLLYRYTMQEDFLIGYTATTRKRSTREVVGYFINSLPVRARIGPDSSLRDIIESAGRNVRAGFAHRDLPLPEIAKVLRLPRDPAGSSFPQVLFSMLVAYPPDPLFDLAGFGGELDYHGLRLSGFDIKQQDGQFDLMIDLVETGSVMKAIIKYNTNLFSNEAIERMAMHFTRILETAVARPDAKIGSISLADPRERAELLAISSGSQDRG